MAIDDDLTTLTKVKAYLGITGSDDDTLLGTLIDAASKAIKQYCKDNISETTYTEYYDGPRTNELALRHRPIVSITDIWDDPDRDFTDDDKLDYSDDDYVYYADEGIVKGYAHLFYEGSKNIKITYTAGYSIIPADVDLACQIQVAYWYNRAKAKSDAVESEKLGEYSISYAKAQAGGPTPAGLCDEARILVRRYRNPQI